MTRTRNDSAVKTASLPTDFYERRALGNGARVVAGVDEAGRGPLAGPVVAAAVILGAGPAPDGIDDSKNVSAAERERLCGEILRWGTVSVVVASAARIDAINILQASLWAMRRAVSALAERPDHVLIDGRDVPAGLCCEGEALIGGDGLSLSIAAASIVAKVSRDRLMARLGLSYPDYGFERHKGYATRAHREALVRHGPCPHHRQSFAPVRAQQLRLAL